MIRTGVAPDCIPAAFVPIIAAAIARFEDWRVDGSAGEDAALLLYGSVATGMARVGASDVDLIALGVDPAAAAALGSELGERFGELCCSAEIGTGDIDGHLGADDESYGARVFLRHYCVLLAGRDPVPGSSSYAGDIAAARGLNGDIGHALEAWRRDYAANANPASLRRGIARKTLLAIAMLASIRDRTWTTDRQEGADRWRRHRPDLADALATLLAWSDGECADLAAVAAMLPPDGVIERVVADYAADIGLWDSGAARAE
jgi:hypothetical protein